MWLPTEPCLSPFMAYRKCAGQRGMEPPNSHCSSGGKYKDRERGASLLGCTGCCPHPHPSLSSPPVPWCSATLLLGDCLLQPHTPHCLSPLTWPFPSCWLGWQWGRVLRRWPLGSDSLRLNPSLHLPSGLQWACGLTI